MCILGGVQVVYDVGLLVQSFYFHQLSEELVAVHSLVLVAGVRRGYHAFRCSWVMKSKVAMIFRI